MKGVVLVVGVIIYGGLLSVLGTHEAAREFNEMCKIYKLLITKPEGIQIYEGDQPLDPSIAARKIMDEINFYNLSTTDDKLYNLIKEKESKEAAGEDLPEVKEINPQQWAVWHRQLKGSKDPKPASAGQSALRPAEPTARERAHKLIGKIYKRSCGIVEKIEGLEQTAKQDLAGAQKHMVSAVFGEAAIKAIWEEKTKEGTYDWAKYEATITSFPGSSSSDGWESGCTKSGSGVGMSMVSDFCCICGIKTSDSANQLCGVNLGSIAAGHYKQRSDGVARWAELKKTCDTIPTESGLGVPSPATLAAAIGLHRSLLGVNWIGHSGFPTTDGHTAPKPFILGRFALSDSGAAGCAGAKYTGNGEGACVDYSEILGKGKEIPWVKEVRKAEPLLEAVEKKKHELQLLLNQMQQEKKMAELVYDEAFLPGPHASETRDGNESTTHQRHSPTATTEKATTHEPSAGSTATIPRFILLWTLLI